MPQDAILLMGLAGALYLWDSALLLHRNEGVVTIGAAGRWAVGLGYRDLELRGKHLYVPNPLLPHRPLFRLAWSFDGSPAAARDDWDAHRALLRPLSVPVAAMASALFILMPLGLFTRLGDAMLLAALLLLYASIVAALIWAWRKRARFGLGRAHYAALAFEALVCPPLALNLARRLCARIALREDLVSAARRLQRGADWDATRALLVARLDEAIETEDEDSVRMAGLVDHRRRLAQE